MEKNNQPLIMTAMIVVGVLIIALVLIFTRSNDDETAPPTTTANNTSETQTTGNTGENSEEGQQPEQPTPEPQPTPQPTPEPDSTPAPEPQPGVLPSNWDSLTRQEKTDLNPYGCDHDTHYVRADNGQCQIRPSSSEYKFPIIVDKKQNTHLEFVCYSAWDGCKTLLHITALEDMHVPTAGTGPLFASSPLPSDALYPNPEPRTYDSEIIMRVGFFSITTEDGKVYLSNTHTWLANKTLHGDQNRVTTKEVAVEASEGGFSSVLFKIPWGEVPEVGSEVTLTSNHTKTPVKLILKVRPFTIP